MPPLNRAILQSLLPAFAALAAACVLLRIVVGVSGARLEIVRLRKLHRSEEGAVQSLSFVLTLPLFIMIVMFIVQVSQLMIGIMGVHYATFAAARAAIVWTPARVVGNTQGEAEEIENELQSPLDRGQFSRHYLKSSIKRHGWRMNRSPHGRTEGAFPRSRARRLSGS